MSKRVRYSKCTYSGPRVNRKRSRATLQHYHGNEVMNRSDVWRNIASTSTDTRPHDDPPIESTNTSTSADTRPQDDPPAESINTYQDQNEPAPVKTYKAVHRKKLKPKKRKLNVVWPECEGIESHQLIIEGDNSIKPNQSQLENLNGYRIVDIKHVLDWALDLQSEHAKVCTFGKVCYVSESRDSLSSTFTFKCEVCNKNFYKTSEKDNKINKAFVWGSLTAASHFSQATHMLSIMDIPAMSENAYKKQEKEFGNIWEQHLLEEMKEAAAKEKEIAIQKGHVHEDGVPYITVHVDGGWSKRSYGHNFNSSSGIACIIGMETKKCLFLGIKNKYCNTCQFNEQKGIEKEHLCTKNFKGSSTSMEAEILVEGFSKSVEMYGLRYTYFVGDGDSSVYARLKEKVPYGNIIKKLECKNHVLKNYTGALYKIAGDTKLPIVDRKLVKEKLNKLIVVARLNINKNLDSAEKMRVDLKNGPAHVFGEHDSCRKYYCKYKKAEETEESIEQGPNYVPQLKKNVLVWALIETAIDNVARKADRLLGNVTNNIAENFMSLMAKYNCGKRINFTRSGAYTRRAQLAGLCQVSGQRWQARAWKAALHKSPGVHFKKHIARQERSSKLRAKLVRKKIFKPAQTTQPDKDYGPKADDVPLEISEEELKNLCELKLKELQINSIEEIEEIQKSTIGQHGNNRYDDLRKDRLTASQFGMVCKRRLSTPFHNHVRNILYKSNFSNDDTKYGQKFETVAIKLFESETGKTVAPSGLFIDREYGFLGASPDGLAVGEEAIVEVKCFPSLARSGVSMEEAAKEKKSFPLICASSEGLEINKKHNFYYQIQGQLKVCRKTRCYLIAFTDIKTPIKTIIIERDEEFITEMMKKIVDFYKTYVLPEVILRRIQNSKK